MIKTNVASHIKDTDDELVVRIDDKYGKMNNNPVYAQFQPQVTQMGDLFKTYKSARTNALTIGSSETTKLKNKTKDELVQFVKLLNTEIEVAANKLGSDELAEAFATGAGTELTKARGKSNKKAADYLDMPADFYVENDRQRKGAATATFKTVDNAVNYAIIEIGEDGKIKNTYYCTKSPYSIQCGESEVKKTYQMYAIGTNNVTSELTEAFTVWVR
jgi:hypothetical protein